MSDPEHLFCAISEHAKRELQHAPAFGNGLRGWG
jgi:hypothetical protein